MASGVELRDTHKAIDEWAKTASDLDIPIVWARNVGILSEVFMYQEVKMSALSLSTPFAQPLQASVSHLLYY